MVERYFCLKICVNWLYAFLRNGFYGRTTDGRTDDGRPRDDSSSAAQSRAKKINGKPDTKVIRCTCKYSTKMPWTWATAAYTSLTNKYIGI